MLHRIIAVTCRIDHIATVDYSLRAVHIVNPAETIGYLARKCSHSEGSLWAGRLGRRFLNLLRLSGEIFILYRWIVLP